MIFYSYFLFTYYIILILYYFKFLKFNNKNETLEFYHFFEDKNNLIISTSDTSLKTTSYETTFDSKPIYLIIGYTHLMLLL